MVAWLIPLLSIILSHIGIFYRIKNSEVNIVLTNAPEKRLANSSRMKQLKRLGNNSDMPNGGNSLPHVTQRVYWKYTYQYFTYRVIFTWYFWRYLTLCKNPYFQVEMEKQLLKMVCVLLLVWFLAWTPYAGMSVWVMFFDANGLSPIIGLIPTICCKLSAASNSLIYGIRYLIALIW